MGFLQILTLELVSNIPVWLGFIAAVKILYESKSRWWLSILIIFASTVISAVLILWFEPIKLGTGTAGVAYPMQVLMMAAVFTIVELPPLWYIATTRSWATWRFDLALAGLLGLAVTVGEALVVSVFDPRVLIMHALSMAAAAGITMPLMRWLKTRSWRVAMSGVMAVTIAASVLIVAIEYMPHPRLIGSVEGASEGSD